MDSIYENNSSADKKSYCPQCGHSVSPGDKFCSVCGNELAVKKEYASFCLKREKKAFMCAAVNDVYLDYQMVCQLENGERYNATLPLGEHHLEIIDKVNFNKTIYSGNFIIGKAGLIMSYTASLKVNDMQMATFPSGHIAEKPATPIISSSPAPSEQNVSFTRQSMPVQQGKICPKCGGQMTLQVINEQKKTGCGTILGYIFLAITILGLLVVIPLLLRKKNESITYAICQSCGYRQKM